VGKTLRRCAADHDPHPRAVPGHAPIRADEDVVDDRRVVDVVRQVKLRAPGPVDAEAVALDEEMSAREELDEVLVPAAVRAHPAAGERALEAVPPDREVGAEAAVNEVASAAVVESVVLDDDVVRPAPEQDAVREARRPVSAVREVAPPDGDTARVGNADERPVARPARSDDEIVEHDIP
jgi:hypothetical protein